MCSCDDGLSITGSSEEKLSAFKQIISTTKNIPVYVLFYSPSCPACIEMLGYWNQFISKCKAIKAKAKLIMVNSNTSPGIFKHYKISAVPRIMVFKNGNKTNDIVGVNLPEIKRVFGNVGILI